MSDKKITYEDVKEYENLFTLAPSFLLGSMIRRNSNLVLKFKSTINSYLKSLDEKQREKLEIILETDTPELQNIMKEAYLKSKKKQYKLLADPKAKGFIEKNLNELRKLI